MFALILSNRYDQLNYSEQKSKKKNNFSLTHFIKQILKEINICFRTKFRHQIIRLPTNMFFYENIFMVTNVKFI